MLKPDLKTFNAALRDYLKTQKSTYRNSDFSKASRDRSADLHSLAAAFDLHPVEVMSKMEALEAQGEIQNLRFADGRLTWFDGARIRKSCDYRKRMKDAGFVSCTVWLTPKQAEFVKAMHSYNVCYRDEMPLIDDHFSRLYMHTDYWPYVFEVNDRMPVFEALKKSRDKARTVEPIQPGEHEPARLLETVDESAALDTDDIDSPDNTNQADNAKNEDDSDSTDNEGESSEDDEDTPIGSLFMPTPETWKETDCTEFRISSATARKLIRHYNTRRVPIKEFVKTAVSVLRKRLLDNPLSYIEYGPYWPALKRVLHSHGVIGPNIPDEWLIKTYGGKTDAETIVMAEAFRDFNMATYFKGQSTWRLNPDARWEWHACDDDLSTFEEIKWLI